MAISPKSQRFTLKICILALLRTSKARRILRPEKLLLLLFASWERKWLALVRPMTWCYIRKCNIYITSLSCFFFTPVRLTDPMASQVKCFEETGGPRPLQKFIITNQQRVQNKEKQRNTGKIGDYSGISQVKSVPNWKFSHSIIRTSLLQHNIIFL